MITVASLHRPQSLSGVSVAGVRLAGLIPGWIPVVIGPGLTRSHINATPFADLPHAQVISWPEHADALEQVQAVVEGLRSIAPQVVVPHDLPHGFLACALDPMLRCAGLFHGDHPRDHDLYERAAPLCDAWRGVSRSITRFVALCTDLPATSPHPDPLPCPMRVGPAGVDLNSRSTLQLLFAGWLDGNKRPLDLIALCDALHNAGTAFELRIAGDGPLLDALKQGLQDHLQSGRARLLGRIDPADMHRLYTECDMLILPSQTEGCPLVVIEAMALGRPVAISKGCGHAADIITNGIDGLIFPIGDMQSLAHRLASLANNRARLGSMGKAAHATALAHFDSSIVSPQVTAWLREALCAPAQDPRARYGPWLRTLCMLDRLTPAALSRARSVYAIAHHLDPATLPQTLTQSLTPRQRLVSHALETLRTAGHQRIALYGAGTHTEHLHRLIADDAMVIAIVDDRAGEPGGPPAWLCHRPVVKPDACRLLGIDALVLSSDGHEELLARRASQWAGDLPIVRLYNRAG